MAWLLQTGLWPSGDIDHINGDRSDNRWVNLRDVSKSKNARNAKQNSRNKSGFNGVSWCHHKKRWIAHIGLLGRFVVLGRFLTKEEAIKARRAADIEHEFSPRHGQPIL
jgi:hypothetical protein